MLTGSAVRRPVATVMAFGAVLLLGLVSAGQLRVQLMPREIYPRFEVVVRMPEEQAEGMERRIAMPLEAVLSQIEGVETIKTVCSTGMTRVEVGFGAAVLRESASLLVHEAAYDAAVRFPRTSTAPAVVELGRASRPLLVLAAFGRGISFEEAGRLCVEELSRALEQVRGVARVEMTAVGSMELRVDLDPERLALHQVDTEAVQAALRAAGVANRTMPSAAPLGFHVASPVLTPEGLAGLPIRRRAHVPEGHLPIDVRLGEVASVRAMPELPAQSVSWQGRPAIGLRVYGAADSNLLAVSGRVGARLAHLSQEYPGLAVEVVYDAAGLVRDVLSWLGNALVFGAILAVLVLLPVLRSWRPVVLIGLVVPVSLTGSSVLLHLLGVSLNLFSLAGLALGVGLLLDNAIVVFESIARRSGASPPSRGACAAGTRQVGRALTGSTLTTVAVFVPILFAQALAGALLRDLATSVAVALLFSLLSAVTLLPALLAASVSQAARPDQATRSFRSFSVLRLRYSVLSRLLEPGSTRRRLRIDERLRSSAMRHPVATTGILFVSAAAGLLAATQLEVVPLPRGPSDLGRIEISTPVALDRGKSSGLIDRLVERLQEAPWVETVFAETSATTPDGQVHRVGSIQLGLTRPMAAHAIRRELERLETTYFPVKIGLRPHGLDAELGAALSPWEIALRVQGANDAERQRVAQELARTLATTGSPGSVMPSSQAASGGTRLEFNDAAAMELGITAAEVVDLLRLHISGVEIDAVRDVERPHAVRLKMTRPEGERCSVLEKLVFVKGKREIALNRVISSSDRKLTEHIYREDGERTAVLLIQSDRARAVLSRALEALTLPPGIFVSLSPESLASAKTGEGLARMLILALLLVYMVLAAQFESLVQPVIVLLCVPAAVGVAAIAMWITGVGLTLVSASGLLVLIGVVVNDAILKVDAINRARAAGHSTQIAVKLASRLRLRPILLTTVTTVAGMLPLLAGPPIAKAIAVPLVSGMVAATVLALTAIPGVYVLLARPRR